MGGEGHELHGGLDVHLAPKGAMHREDLLSFGGREVGAVERPGREVFQGELDCRKRVSLTLPSICLTLWTAQQFPPGMTPSDVDRSGGG